MAIISRKASILWNWVIVSTKTFKFACYKQLKSSLRSRNKRDWNEWTRTISGIGISLSHPARDGHWAGLQIIRKGIIAVIIIIRTKVELSKSVVIKIIYWKIISSLWDLLEIRRENVKEIPWKCWIPIKRYLICSITQIDLWLIHKLKCLILSYTHPTLQIKCNMAVISLNSCIRMESPGGLVIIRSLIAIVGRRWKPCQLATCCAVSNNLKCWIDLLFNPIKWTRDDWSWQD